MTQTEGQAASAINPRLGGLALAGGIVGISMAPIFVQLSDIGPTATAVWRMAFALPLLTLWMMLRTGTGQRRGGYAA